MYKWILLFVFVFVFVISDCFAQNKKYDTLFVASWNLENLFDAVNDPAKDDEEFLPEGMKEWTQERLDKKLYNIARVIRSMNNNRGPDILGVVETEHQSVLDSMEAKFLSDLNYSTAYLESPDNRGIDNGVIFKKDLFKVLSISGDTVSLPDNYPTRLILNVNFLTKNNDTIHVFENHWPSRRGGEKESEINRVTAAMVLSKNVQRILDKNPHALILIMGDFNDEPTNKSILKTLKAEPVLCDSLTSGMSENKSDNLFNLSYSLYNQGLGTYKYKDDWNMLDQIIVSVDLLTGSSINYLCNTFEIYKPEFMVTHSGKYKGTPFPTYGGNRYLGGYSDHFPVIARFLIISR